MTYLFFFWKITPRKLKIVFKIQIVTKNEKLPRKERAHFPLYHSPKQNWCRKVPSKCKFKPTQTIQTKIWKMFLIIFFLILMKKNQTPTVLSRKDSIHLGKINFSFSGVRANWMKSFPFEVQGYLMADMNVQFSFSGNYLQNMRRIWLWYFKMSRRVLSQFKF